MLELTVNVTGRNESELVDGLNEVVRHLNNGMTSGFDGNDDESYSFDLSKVIKDKNAYYIAEIFERNGEYTYSQNFPFTIGKRASPEKRLNQIVKTWYEDATDVEKDGDGYYFNCGEVYVEGRKCSEINKETFETLSKYL